MQPSVASTQTQTFQEPERESILDGVQSVQADVQTNFFELLFVSALVHQCVEADVEMGEPSLLESGQASSQSHPVGCHANRLQAILCARIFIFVYLYLPDPDFWSSFGFDLT